MDPQQRLVVGGRDARHLQLSTDRPRTGLDAGDRGRKARRTLRVAG